MVIANREECTDHLISFHFHAKIRLNRAFTIISIAKSVIYMFGCKYSGSDICLQNGIFAKRKNSLPFDCKLWSTISKEITVIFTLQFSRSMS